MNATITAVPETGNNPPTSITDTFPEQIEQPASIAASWRARLNLRKLAFAVAALVAVTWSVRYAIHAWHYEETDNAYLVGHLHQVSPQISGQVMRVLVQDNQIVKAGDVLFELDPLEYEISVQQATAALAGARAKEAQAAAATEQARAALAEATARATQAVSQVNQSKAQLELSRITLARAEQLVSTSVGAIPQADMDTARSNFASSTAALAAAEANYEAAQASAKSAVAAQSASLAQAEAAKATTAAAAASLKNAERELDNTKIKAPSDGRIGARTVEVGNRVQSGQLLCALAEPNPWVVANFKETQLAHMQAGQEVDLAIDAIPGEKLIGHVDSFSPASGAQFALLPPDNATGNFNKVVQRIPVKITLDDQTLARLGNRLHLGYSVVAEVRVR